MLSPSVKLRSIKQAVAILWLAQFCVMNSRNVM